MTKFRAANINYFCFFTAFISSSLVLLSIYIAAMLVQWQYFDLMQIGKVTIKILTVSLIPACLVAYIIGIRKRHLSFMYCSLIGALGGPFVASLTM